MFGLNGCVYERFDVITTPPLRGTPPREGNYSFSYSPPVEGWHFAQQNDGVVLRPQLLAQHRNRFVQKPCNRVDRLAEDFGNLGVFQTFLKFQA